MFLAKRIKAAYDICVGCDEFTQDERDHVHFYLAIRSIVFKLTKGDAPNLAHMNAKVQQMIAEALQSDGVEEIFKIGQGDTAKVDIFDPDYMAKIDKIKLPNTKRRRLTRSKWINTTTAASRTSSGAKCWRNSPTGLSTCTTPSKRRKTFCRVGH